MELGEILLHDLFRDFSKGESLYLYLIEDIMCKRLEIHDLSRDTSQTRKFALEQGKGILIELHHTVFECFDVALHCSDRGTDLMRQIREEFCTDFFLDRERFMEIIDRRDKWHEFIFPAISYRSISFTVDDILDVSDDSADRAKDRPDPEKISEEYEKQPYNIDEYYALQDMSNETSLDRILSERPEIKCRKYIFLRGS